MPTPPSTSISITLERAHRDVDQSYRNWLGVRIATDATVCFLSGKAGPTIQTCTEEYITPPRIITSIVDRLIAKELLTNSARGLLPAKSPSELTVSEVVEAMMESGSSSAAKPMDDAIQEVLARGNSATDAILKEKSLEDLAKEQLDGGQV